MSPSEATSNMVIALINQKFIGTPEEVAIAYKEIFKAVTKPMA